MNYCPLPPPWLLLLLPLPWSSSLSQILLMVSTLSFIDANGSMEALSPICTIHYGHSVPYYNIHRCILSLHTLHVPLIRLYISISVENMNIRRQASVRYGVPESLGHTAQQASRRSNNDSIHYIFFFFLFFGHTNCWEHCHVS